MVWNYQGSGAYGIPQALPASKMASAGADYMTNPATEIRWGLGYVARPPTARTRRAARGRTRKSQTTGIEPPHLKGGP